jgi:hypothetical protein
MVHSGCASPRRELWSATTHAFTESPAFTAASRAARARSFPSPSAAVLGWSFCDFQVAAFG